MALGINHIINVPLIAEQEENQIMLVDRLYAKAYDHYQMTVAITFVYTIIKIISAPIFLCLMDGDNDEDNRNQMLWLILLIPLSIAQAGYYWIVYNFCKNKEIFLLIANKVNHAGYFMLDQISGYSLETSVHDQIVNFRNPQVTEIVDKQVKVLALEIKYDVLKQNFKILLISRFLFVLYTALHVWGYIIFITSKEPSVADYFILVIFFLGTYHYLEIYLFIVGVIVVLPLFLVYQGVKTIRKRLHARRIAKMLEGEKYDPLKFKGEQSCHICLCEYQQNDIITKLACNQMHHFHKTCLEEWIRVSGTCPLCRDQIGQQ